MSFEKKVQYARLGLILENISIYLVNQFQNQLFYGTIVDYDVDTLGVRLLNLLCLLLLIAQLA
jgi:hypothetical protein